MIIKNLPGLFMTEHDLAELYTYLELFSKVYGGFASETAALRAGILDIYMEEHRVKDADKALRELRNPRSAGRKSSVTDEMRARITDLRKSGKTIREIATSAGVPRSTVQRILSGR